MALNKILQGIVRDFQTKYSLDGEESKVFEHLANYIIVMSCIITTLQIYLKIVIANYFSRISHMKFTTLLIICSQTFWIWQVKKYLMALSISLDSILSWLCGVSLSIELHVSRLVLKKPKMN
mgnify:CR=1 FL=1